jgi:hypothetical protein
MHKQHCEGALATRLDDVLTRGTPLLELAAKLFAEHRLRPFVLDDRDPQCPQGEDQAEPIPACCKVDDEVEDECGLA